MNGCMRPGQECRFSDTVVTVLTDGTPIQWQECKRCGRHRRRPESLLEDKRYQEHFLHFLDQLDLGS